MNRFKDNLLLYFASLSVLLILVYVGESSAQSTPARRYAKNEYEFLDHGDCLYNRSMKFSTVYNEWAGRMQKEIIDLGLMKEVSDHFARLEACPSWPKPPETELK